MITKEEVETLFHKTFDRASRSPFVSVNIEEDRLGYCFSVCLRPAALGVIAKVSVSASQIMSLVDGLQVEPGRLFVYPSSVGYEEYLYFVFFYDKA